MFLQLPRQRVEVTRPRVTGKPRPRRKRFTRSGDSGVNIFFTRLRDACQRLFVGRVERIEAFTGFGLDELAADKQVETALMT